MVAPNGSSVYVVHALVGVFSFNPTNPTAKDAMARWVIMTGDAGIGAGVLGLHHTSSLWNLMVTWEKTVHITKILNGRGGNPLESGRLEAYKLNLDYHCNYLYSNDDYIEMIFANMVIIIDYAFIFSQPKHLSKAHHNGVAMYRLTWDKDNGAWHNCVQVTGDREKPGGLMGLDGTLTSQIPPATWPCCCT